MAVQDIYPGESSTPQVDVQEKALSHLINDEYRSEYALEEDPEKLYVATIEHIRWDDRNIAGNITLQKIGKKKRLFGWNRALFGEYKQSLEWNLETGACFVIAGGELRNKRDDFGYRRRVIEAANRRGILLPKPLLEQIFAPLDKAMVDLYQKLLPYR